MDPVTTVASSGVIPLERYAFVMNKTFPEVMTRTARGLIRRGIAIMPPATAQGVAGGLDSGSEAKQRGFRAIERDLNKVFVPVRLKGRRKEAITGAEMVRIHQRHLAHKRPGAPMRRDRAQPYYVDARKFTALATKLRSHVGRLAAGWMPAAQAVKQTAPAWISRHGLSRGSVQMDLEGTSLYFRAVNHAPNAPAAIVSEAQRRVNYATAYQANAMNREMQHLLLKRAGEVGLKVA